MRLINALVLEFDKLAVEIEGEIAAHSIVVENDDLTFEVKEFHREENLLFIKLSGEINIKSKVIVSLEAQRVEAIYSRLYNSDEFNKRYFYGGELGAVYSRDETTLRLWSPAAKSVELMLYKSGDPSINEVPERVPMIEENGLWSISIPGDLKGSFYTFEVNVFGNINEAVDPYAKACGINGLRGAIISLETTNPEGWDSDTSPQIENYTDAIIYETSVRDISIHPNSGIVSKGKYIGLTEDNTKSTSGDSTGIEHIIELGVTHVQLMPVFDFSYKSVDEGNPLEKYNWGYDPQNYNVPEGSYSSNPFDPLCRIKEFKSMVSHLHGRGLCVNMDVVYNHLYEAKGSSFEKIFPGYYFRLNKDGSFINGSGCGNDTASEHKMMRKFIVDSVLYWAIEYHIDGFRFDLMGLHDIQMINIVRAELNKLPKSIMLYGEGWDIPTGIPTQDKATQYNAYSLPEIGFFNDTIRDSVRGSVFERSEKGFVSCRGGLEDRIKKSAAGCIHYDNDISGIYASPLQAINYVSAHDNNTLWDKLEACASEFNLEDRKSMQKLSNAIVLTSQGIPFLHSGVEFCRTKKGVENSYKSPDEINWMDWNRKTEFKDVFEYYKGLIRIRREHPALRMPSADKIKRNLRFLHVNSSNTVAFLIDGKESGDSWNNILIVYNGNHHSLTLDLPEGVWELAADNNSTGTPSLGSISEGVIEVCGLSMYILFKN